MISFVYFFEVY